LPFCREIKLALVRVAVLGCDGGTPAVLGGIHPFSQGLVSSFADDHITGVWLGSLSTTLQEEPLFFFLYRAVVFSARPPLI